MIRIEYVLIVPYLIFLASFIAIADSNESYENYSILTIIADVPEGTGTVYLPGNLPELGPWDPQLYPMKGNGTRRIAALVVPVGSDIEFKFTLGSWDTEALDHKGDIPGNHIVSVSGDTTFQVTIPKFRPSWNDEFGLSETEAIPDSGSTLIVHSPRQHQVFQRRSVSDGMVLISGRSTIPCDVIEYAVFFAESTDTSILAWRSTDFDSRTYSFSTQEVLPAGGWYTMIIRCRRGKKTVNAVTVSPFGIGEVFVGAGQSNSTNCGEERLSPKSGMVTTFSGSYWRPAHDPQPGTHDKSREGSFWPAFGDAIYRRIGVPIGVAVTGQAGSSIAQWSTDGKLYPWMMHRILQLGPQGFRALLWHQGEADYDMSSQEYSEKLSELINRAREDAAWEFPWFVAQASYHNPDNDTYDNVREGQNTVIGKGIALNGPDTDTLGEDYREQNGRGVHFNGKGLIAHGELWAQIIGDYLERLVSGK